MSENDKEVLKTEIKKSLESDDEIKLQKHEGLKKELLAEIEKESLKKEILNELKPKDPFWETFFKHPAFLLIAGFILTTLLGTTLTSYWQYKTWSGQQKYLEQQNKSEQWRITQQAKIKQKYEIKDEIIKTVAETNTAAEDILLSLTWDSNDSRRKAEALERAKSWREASQNWRTNSKILRDKVVFRFSEPQILTAFIEIVRLRSTVGGEIYKHQNQIEESKGSILNKKNPKHDEFVNGVLTTNGKISQFVSLTENLMKAMLNEIQKDEAEPNPTDIQKETSFIKWIWG